MHSNLMRLLFCLAITMMWPAAAKAGGFTYYACQNPDGQWNGTAAGFSWDGIGAGANFGTDCGSSPTGMYLSLSDRPSYEEGTRSRLVFAAPADTKISGVALSRETHGLRRCNTATTPCSPSQNLLHYDLEADAVKHDTCSPFAPGPDGTGQCNSGLSGVFTSRETSADRISLKLECGFVSSGPCARDTLSPPQVIIPWVRVRLDDSAGPTVSSVSGALAAPASHRGVESLSYNVTDRGAGIYRGLVEVDGKAVYDQVVDPNVVGGRARCKDVQPGDSDPYQFMDPVPCKLSTSATVAFDTRTVTDGEHVLRVVVEDASGNRTTVLGPQKFSVDNVPSPDDPACRNGIDDDMDGVVDGADSGCSGGEDVDETPLPTVPTVAAPPTPQVQPGAGAPQIPGSGAGDGATSRGAPNGDRPSDDARLTAGFGSAGRRILTTAFGKRALVRGKLVDGRGAPIANARVELMSRNASPGSPLLDKGGARTRADGTWTLILPRDVSSRTLSFRYRSHLGDAQPVSEVALTLRVRAAVAMTVTPRDASSRGSILISGRLLGGPLPARGKVVELQARGKGGGRWITFRTVRSDARGRYRTRYQFRNTVGPVTYVFRARAREEAAYPFLTGVSRVVAVRVR